MASLPLASCGAQTPVESISENSGAFSVTEHGTFAEPWAAAFEPGTDVLFVTEKAGTIKFYNPATGTTGNVTGAPAVDYGGQGGLGDIAFGPDYAASKAIYLSWAEAGEGDTRGAVVGRGTLDCSAGTSCAIKDLRVIWRQSPKVTGRGHYSHRIIFSPDGQYMYVASGDRQKMQPAQDLSNNLGSIVRLTLDGDPAPGNPFAEQGGISREIWSYGHRNILGMQFDGQGRLWDLEHGPKGGDELNLVRQGANYGWPIVSGGIHYDNDPIPDHSTRPEFAAPAIQWTPVIAPGNFIFYDGEMFPEWRGDALIAGLKSQAVIRVSIEGETAAEVARYPMGERIRQIVEGPDGAIWVLEDTESGRLLRLTPPSRTD
ncbi:PQQ-dependent sugar dehydrogenase [Allopontixanthobacter sp.]|uniref:PQQ-dependent sugar dehydrogenase n=1 Tax=Allopontixanthobacter sp. TaxID=2906452 RepID=UPI002AC9AC0C|nr:PQQ-dependent sugar dehydrogenase [Allopontixanthobacter sp.]